MVRERKTEMMTMNRFDYPKYEQIKSKGLCFDKKSSQFVCSLQDKQICVNCLEDGMCS